MPQLKLGELLVKANVLSEAQLSSALSEQKRWGGRLGEILVRMALLSEELLVKALSKQLQIPATDLDAVQAIRPEVAAKIPADVAKDLSVIPLQLRDDGRTLVVAMAEPQNLRQIDTLRAVAGCRIVAQVAGRMAIARAHGRCYNGTATFADSEGSFKFVDAQGRTIVRSEPQPQPQPQPEPGRREARSPPTPSPEAVKYIDAQGNTVAREAPAAIREMRAERASKVEAARGAPSVAQMLDELEELQRREVASLKAMVELLIQKGLFTREEYLAKLRR